MKITLCARSKILTLLEDGSTFRIQATALQENGQHVDLIPNSDPKPNDLTISHVPRVVIDYATATLLAGQTIDFDYAEQEFVISNRDKA